MITPAEAGRELALQHGPLTDEQARGVARVLATVEPPPLANTG